MYDIIFFCTENIRKQNTVDMSSDKTWWYFFLILYVFLLAGIIIFAILYPLRAAEIGPSGPSGASGLPATPGGVQGLSIAIRTAITSEFDIFFTSQVQLSDVDPATAIIPYSDLAPYDLTLNGFVLHGAFSNSDSSGHTVTGNVYRGDTSSSAPGAVIGNSYVSGTVPAFGSLNQSSVVVTFTTPVLVQQGERLAFALFTNGCTINSLSVALFWT